MFAQTIYGRAQSMIQRSILGDRFKEASKFLRLPELKRYDYQWNLDDKYYVLYAARPG